MRHLIFAADGSGTSGPSGLAIEERATQSHRVWAQQDTEDSAAADVEPARRKAVF